MEKLIELLNEYKPQADFIYKGGIRKEIPWDKDVIMNKDLLIISKQFWFIKRLVDNDKIDLDKLEKIWYEETVYEWYWQYREIVEYSDCESLLMLLAISENPIEDLISYLK